MRKIYSLVLMATMLLVGTNAWADPTEIVVNDFNALKTALSTSGTADVVKLGQDIAYPSNGGSDLLDIQRSLTLDGQGHKLSGYAIRGAHTGQGNNGQYNKVTLVINHQAEHSGLVVTLKNVEITQNGSLPSHTVGVFVYDGVDSLAVIENSILRQPGSVSNATPLALYGESSTPLKILVRDSKVLAGSSSYGVVVLKPIKAYFENSTFSGYSAMTFKLPLGLYPGNRWTVGFGTANIGARGSIINATNSNFEAPNIHSGESNGYGTFVFEEDGVNMKLTNCGFNAEALGNATQGVFVLNGWYVTKDHETQDINITISGDNTHFNGQYVDNAFFACRIIQDGTDKGYGYENGYVVGSGTLDKYTSSDINVTVEGGTFAVNPETYEFNAHVSTSDPHYADGAAIPTVFTKRGFTIASGYEVQEVKQGNVPLYRVVKAVAKDGSDNPLYNLNDNVESQGDGKNATTSFELSDGSDMTLGQQTTTAGNVQIKDNGTDGTTVTVGTDTQDQTLIINNGLSVEGNSQVVVQSGSTLKIGEGGITTEEPENIVIEADEDGAASLLLDPTITVNQTPKLTVRMLAKQIGREGVNFNWHRFAMPVDKINSWDKEGSLEAADPGTYGAIQYPTYLYGWDYANNDWANIGVAEMKPLQGYTLTLASDYIHVDGTGKVTDESAAGGNLNEYKDVTYIFKGNLVGNTNQAINFQAEGFNFFGNSYTGYMDVLTLIQGFVSNNVEGTVYMWCNDPADDRNQSYVGVPLYYLQSNVLRSTLEDWQKEVAPMQTFILRLRGANTAKEEVDYASAIWGNPRYGNTPAGAPSRVVATNNIESHLAIVVKANGKGSRVEFTQDANYTDAFESGCDVVKYMNENTINLYATVNGEDLSSVVTNSLNGKLLSLQTNDEVNYTMSFKNVAGTEYAILDHATNQMTVIAEGNTYQFAAQPNSTVEGRFEIVPIQNMPTAVETVETTATVKGIYTIMGQYVGEDFESLPAGVYVVDGVKIVK